MRDFCVENLKENIHLYLFTTSLISMDGLK
jgi:hypothetical protein